MTDDCAHHIPDLLGQPCLAYNPDGVISAATARVVSACKGGMSLPYAQARCIESIENPIIVSNPTNTHVTSRRFA